MFGRSLDESSARSLVHIYRCAGLVLCSAALLGCFMLGVRVERAAAFETHPYEPSTSFSLPGGGVPFGVAVNQTTNHVYVTDGRTAVYDFNPDGSLNAAHPRLTGAASAFEPVRVAVDNSGGADNGNIYVAGSEVIPGSPNARYVQQFDSSGNATSTIIDASDIPADGTPQSGGLPPVVNDGEFNPGSTAIGPEGDIFIYDRKNRRIDQFSSSGAFVAQLQTGNQTAGLEIAVGPSGEIYGANGFGLIKLNPQGECVNGCTPIDGGAVEDVTVTASGDVLDISRTEAQTVNEYSSSGTLLSTSGSEVIGRGVGIATDEASGKVFVTDQQPFPGQVDVFGPTVILPDAETEGVEVVTDRSATVSGSIGAAGGPSATCVFQYVDAEGFASHRFDGAAEAPCEHEGAPAGPFTGTSMSPVEAGLRALTGGTTYNYRLLGVNENGSHPGATLSFTTLGPTVTGTSFSGVTVDGARLEGSIDPNGVATSYSFQYVTQSAFEASGFAGAAEAPLPRAPIGSGTATVPVAQIVSGLAKGTAYRFRVRAVSSDGSETFGPNLQFVTYREAVPGLPDGRAYEQASPVDKNGANVLGETNAIEAAASGNAITFYSNAGIPGGEGAQGFPIYMGSRSASDWSTQGLLPPASTGPNGEVNGWNDELNTAFVANKAVGASAEFFARDSGDHSLVEIARGGGSKNVYRYTGTSADGNLVAFENVESALVPGAASGQPNGYLWERSSGRLFLGTQLNTGNAPAGGALAGSYEWFNLKEPGAERSYAYYTQTQHVLSDDGSRFYFTSIGPGQIYLRENPTKPQSAMTAGNCRQPNARACTYQISVANPGVADLNGPQPAVFLGATRDGGTAFFMSGGKLTADASTGPADEGRDLYRYDTASREVDDITPDPAEESKNGAEVQGVLGYSDDGTRVYFAANGVLGDGAAAGATRGNCRIGQEAGECNVYVAVGSAVHFIARLAPGQSNQAESRSDLYNWSPTSARERAGDEENTARVTPDGRTLLFRTTARLGTYDNRGLTELYRYRLGDVGPVCVSCNPSATPASGAARLQDPIERLAGPKLPFAIQTRNLSEDGDRIFFETPDPLLASDVNGVSDVYEWEAPDPAEANDTCTPALSAYVPSSGGCLFLISSGTSPVPSTFADASASGSDVFFFTAQQLVGQDRDELVDVYDARIGGGLPSQERRPPTVCSQEDCAGPPVSPPGLPGPSTVAPGPGNPKALRCKKGLRKVRKHGHERCVKRKHHHRRKKHRHGRRPHHPGKAKHHTKRGA